MSCEIDDPTMQSIRCTTHSSISGSDGAIGYARHCTSDCATDSRRREGFLCTSEGNRNLSRFRRATQRQAWRGLRSFQLGSQEHSIHAGHFPGGVIAFSSPDAGAAGRRLRRHDDLARRNVEIDRSSGKAGARGLPPRQASLLLPHLSGSKRSRQMDRN